MLVYNLVLWVVQVLFMIAFFRFTMKEKGDLKTETLWIAACVTAACFLSYFKMLSRIGSVLHTVLSVLNTFMLVPYMALEFEEKVWKKILIYLVMIGAGLLSEIITLTLFHVTDRVGILNLKNSVLVSLCMTVLFGILIGLAILLFNRYLPRQVRLSHFVLFFLFPLSQAAIYFAVDKTIVFNGTKPLTGDPLFFGGFFVGLLADLGLLYLMIWDEKREKIRLENDELKHLRELEQVHFHALEEQQHAFAKIRHDYKNQLAAALNLIREGKTAEAEENLSAVAGAVGMENASEKFSANSIINAVMAEKAAECRERGIELKTELDVGEVPGIQSLHLCGIFSNLMDNAIHAAGDYGKGAYISLRAGIRGGYLVIREENSSADPREKKSTRKGYGQEIINDIVRIYTGDFRHEWKDGIYTAAASLKTG